MPFIKYLFFAVCIFFNLSVLGQGEPELSSENFFNRKVIIRKNSLSKEFIYVYLIKKEKIIDSALAAMIIYDTSGNMTRYERYDEPLFGNVRYDYIINECGATTKVQITRPKNQNTTIELMYDSANNEIVRSTSSKYSMQIEWKEYDSLHRLIRKFDKFNNSKRYLSTTYTWDNKFRMLKKQGFDEFGKPSYSETNQFSKDSLIVKTFFQNKFVSKIATEATYNNNHELLVEVRYQDDLQLHTDYHYSYNENGTIAQWSIVFKDRLVYLKRHFYYYFD